MPENLHPALFQRTDRSERTFPETAARLVDRRGSAGDQQLPESESILDQEVLGVNMASNDQADSWTEETICPICLDFFTDPASLECGHNFCHSCITQCWERSARNSCPECREEFQEIILRVNRPLARLAEKARGLKLNPTEKESKIHCEEHQEELKLFCENDKKLICVICRDAREHKSHNFMPIKEAVEIHKEQVKSSLTSLTERKFAILKIEQQQKQKISGIRDQSRSLESHISSEFTKIHQSLTEKEQRLIRDIRKREERVVDLMERNLREIQKNLTSIEEEISMLQKQVEQKDGVIFLKEESCRKRRVGDDQTLTVKHGILTKEEFAGPLPFPVWREMFDDIHPVSVTLNVGTAGPELEVSEDRRSVRWTETRRDLPDTGKRFTVGPCVLGSEGFTSGRHYWEVEVAESRGWRLGVAAESVKRKGGVGLIPENGFWIIVRAGDDFYVNTSPPSRLPAGPIPGRVGVYLSYESGRVSFYSADTKSHLHTFTGNKFTEKLYPFFATLDGRRWLRICSGSAPGLSTAFSGQVATKSTFVVPSVDEATISQNTRDLLTTAFSCFQLCLLPVSYSPWGAYNTMVPEKLYPALLQRTDRSHRTFPETATCLVDSRGTAGVQQLPESESILDQEVLGVNMASKYQVDSWTKEAICPICLDFFTDPVSLQCGHNFCRSCITRCWESAQRNSCPECREVFQGIILRVNRPLARLVEKARELKLNPTEKESKLHCEEHQEKLKLFCENDKKLICLICRDARKHKSHNFMPIKEAVEIYKEQVKSSLTSLTERKLAVLRMEQRQKQKISGIRDQSRSLESHISSEFTKIYQSLTEKEQRLIGDLRKREKRIVRLMERNLREIQTNLTCIEKELSMLQKQVEQKDGVIFLKEVSCRKRRVGDDQILTVMDGAQTKEEFAGPLPFPVWREMLDDIHPVSVTLDVETAGPWLEVTEDRKSVRWTRTRTRKDLPDTGKRFTVRSCVLGSERFTSGRHYWEVEVAGNWSWELGVVAESVERKGGVGLIPENGFWTIVRAGDGFHVNTSPRSRLLAGRIPGRVGVFLSYGSGTVSFYNADTKSHLHTFTGNKFTEKLYPFFATLDGRRWLRICSGSTPDMASRAFQTDSFADDLNCPICLDFFIDPVTMECGHNFCRSCITQCWGETKKNSCPECREVFQDGKFRVNWALASLAQKARMLKVNQKEKESKHHCEEHEEELKLFCETDKKLICVICRDAREHKSHNFMPIKEVVDIYKVKSKQKEICQTSRVISRGDALSLVDTALSIEELNGPFQYKIWRELINAVKPAPASLTLDPNTAHSHLILSEDHTSVRLGEQRKELPDTPERFDHRACVLGSKGFESEKHYWEVEVGTKTCWELGVVLESADRKGRINMKPETGYYIICLVYGNSYVALTSPRTPLTPRVKPCKIGVYLDHKGGQVSFYNADNMNHLHTFTHAFKGRVFPLFNPGLNTDGKNSAPLIIHGVPPTDPFHSAQIC
ncbi:uncharacterized protein LOC127585825 [Pristis pectinata]|uniref:uncharacterized protein LOC127585825 n=1 Tax=Pristis pectinata TaxID=685728 RepID=UPI00223D34BB|nr:uncharacterized protein LOC127585825 [Pristis pectinata]